MKQIVPVYYKCDECGRYKEVWVGWTEFICSGCKHRQVRLVAQMRYLGLEPPPGTYDGVTSLPVSLWLVRIVDAELASEEGH